MRPIDQRAISILRLFLIEPDYGYSDQYQVNLKILKTRSILDQRKLHYFFNSVSSVAAKYVITLSTRKSSKNKARDTYFY